jgi:hypothetical protein
MLRLWRPQKSFDFGLSCQREGYDSDGRTLRSNRFKMWYPSIIPTIETNQKLHKISEKKKWAYNPWKRVGFRKVSAGYGNVKEEEIIRQRRWSYQSSKIIGEVEPNYKRRLTISCDQESLMRAHCHDKTCIVNLGGYSWYPRCSKRRDEILARRGCRTRLYKVTVRQFIGIIERRIKPWIGGEVKLL